MTEGRGPVTFLMTDIERSSGHWERSEADMSAHLAEHDRIIRGVVERHRGRLFKHTGDGAAAEFSMPVDALAAAVDIQREMADQPLRVRIGVHTGIAQSRDGDHFGLSVTRCARLMGLGHGGQVLVSAATADLVADAAASGVTLVDLGTHALRGLERPERVLQVVADGLGHDFAPLQSATAESTLPAARTELVGRKREIDQVRGLVLTKRLVTLTGIGGCGKTRLAVETASTLLDEFPGGVFFVDLSATADESSVPRDVAAGLRLQLGGLGVAAEVDASAETVAFLADRRALVVLDNCEHLIDACGDLVDRLLGRCSRLSVLATSRESLEVEGEHSYRVPSLGLPAEGGSGGEAVDLFVQRAGTARGEFALTPANQATVAEICRRLDGIPLAIELAASQVAHLDVADLLARLDDRFHLLVGGRRRAQRQQTLQAAIDWSYDLLTPEEQALLRRLSVFAGGFTLEAVEGAFGSGVGGDPVRLLAALVAKSLVVRDEDGAYGSRYRLLESIRLYAAALLVTDDEAVVARDAHRNWFLSVAESRSLDEGMLGLAWAARLAEDHDNHRAALEWSRSQGQVELVARQLTRLSSMWWMLGYYTEGSDWVQVTLVDADQLDANLLAMVHLCGVLASMMGGLADAGPRAVHALEVASDELKFALPWLALGLVLSDPDRSERLFAEFRQWPGSSEFPAHQRYAADGEGVLSWVRGDLEAAAQHFERALVTADWEAIGFGETMALVDLFVTRLMQRRHDELAPLVQQMRDRSDPLAGFSARWGVTPTESSPLAAFTVAMIYERAVHHDHTGALGFAIELVEIVRRHRIPLLIGDCAVALGALAYHRGEHAVAYALVASAGLLGPQGRVVSRMPAGYSLNAHYARRIARALEREAISVDGVTILDPEDAVEAELARLGVSL